MTAIDLSALEADLEGSTAIDLSALEAALAALPKARKGGTSCSIQDAAKGNPDAVPIIRKGIASHASAEAVSRVLKRGGIDIGATSILRHRRGECTQCREAQS